MARPPSFPISVRLSLWYALALLLLLSAFAVFCYAGYHAAVHRSFDRHLEHEFDAIAPLVEVRDGQLDGRALDASAAVATRQQGANGTYVRLLSVEGRVVYASPNLSGRPALPVALPEDGGRRSLSRTWAGDPARTLVAPVVRGGRAVGFVEVTGVECARHRELRELATLLVLGVLTGVLVALGAGWWLARRALRPVAVLTAAAARMSADGARLGERLPADFETDDELTRLAETVNGLLARLEASVERERRFTANAAHELLTPLATLRSEAEVTLRRERDAPAYREVLAHVVEDAAAMAATVQGLLRLARVEALPAPPEGVLDLGALVRDRVARLRPMAEAKGLALDLRAEPDVTVAAEAAPLADVVDNLVSNAVKYTPPGGRVTVSLGRAGGAGAVRLEVADSGVGFDPAEGPRLFDRFHRADTPEVQAEAGSGLGLAIARAVVEGYGGAVGCASDGPGEGARFWAELPGGERMERRG